MIAAKLNDSVFLAGPTAVGKSAVAMCLARALGGEIISVDSMQVYRGLDIGTAKPSVEEQLSVPHHLINVADVTEPFDAACFVRLAAGAEAAIRERGHLPVFCGGTGLYFQAYLAGLGEAPPSDPAVRAELKRTPLADLLIELAKRDPVSFERIDQRNPRRVIRAVEVIRLTGKPFSAQRAAWPREANEGQPSTARTFICLGRSAEDLQARINARVETMFAKGLVAETERLMGLGLARNPIAMQAIGYRQVVEHLHGERSLSATIERVKQRTRQFAKRQLTWFHRQTPARWITLAPEDNAEVVAERIAREVAEGPEKAR